VKRTKTENKKKMTSATTRGKKKRWTRDVEERRRRRRDWGWVNLFEIDKGERGRGGIKGPGGGV
jgi:hypothetical protein